MQNTVQLSAYSYRETATPIDASQMNATAGEITVSSTEDENTRFLIGRNVDLAVNTQGITRGNVKSISGSSGDVTLNADSRLGLLVAEKTAQPFVGTVGNLIIYWCGLVDIPASEIIIDSAVASQAIAAPGWTATVWDEMNKLLIRTSAEISYVSNKVVVRGLRQRIAENYRDASDSWQLSNDDLARSVEVNFYTKRALNNEFFYPRGGWTPEVPVFTVNAGETETYEVDLEASMSSVRQPTVVSAVSRTHTASSVYMVSGNDGLPIPPAQWEAEGGGLEVTINPDTRSLTVTLTGSYNTALAPYYVAMASGTSNRYSSLRLIGTGVEMVQSTISIPTGVDPKKVSVDVGATIDNEYIDTYSDAYDIGVRAAQRYASPVTTISVQTEGINRNDDGGTYVYPPFATFNAMYVGQTFAQFNTARAGQKFSDLNKEMIALVTAEFPNQAFGNVAGARVRRQYQWTRITDATIGDSSISYNAVSDTMYSDFNTEMGARTFADFNSIWSGKRFDQFNVRPLFRGQ